MHGIAFLTADTDAGAVDLGQAVDIVELDAEQVLDTLAHLVAPALGADDALLELNLVAQAALLDFLAEQQRVARSRTQHGGLEIDHHLDLLLGVAGPHGHRHGAELLATCLEPDSRSPQAVTWRNLHTVFLGNTRVFVAARELRRPVVDVFLGVGNHDRRARRARRRVNPHDLAGRNGNRPERVGRAQVGFVREGQLGKVLGSIDRIDVDARELLRIHAVFDGHHALELPFYHLELLVCHLHGINRAFLVAAVCCLGRCGNYRTLNAIAAASTATQTTTATISRAETPCWR